MKRNTPFDYEIVKSKIAESGIESLGKANIREIVKIANQVEKATGLKYIRLEMGVPGLPVPQIATNAEIDALKKGVGSQYPNIEGIRILKEETSRFLKLFLNIDVNAQGCVPTVGSMMGGMITFLVANRNDHTKEGTLFIDPGFPVQKLQVQLLGHDYHSFDVYDYRGPKLREKLDSFLKPGKISSILYSNPNNPTWICLTEEELEIIGTLARKYDVIVIEDLAYFGMDFRKDYSQPGKPPFQPTVAHYCDDYVLLVSSSKIFSYAGQRIGMLAISDHLFNRRYPDLLRYYSTDKFGHSLIYGALYALSAGVTHSTQYGLAALFKAVNDGEYKYFEDVREYGEKARIMKEIFTSSGFTITYDRDLDEKLADGFYFTVSYPGMIASKLVEELLYYGVSTLSLEITGTENKEGLRICVSQIPREDFGILDARLKKFRDDHPIK
jgi:aspartate/methionine/tyrosine aminotransferase